MRRERVVSNWTWAFVAVSGLALAACEVQEDVGIQPAEPELVIVRPVERRVITEWDEYLGRLEAVERVDIRSRVSGYLRELHFDDGDIVEKGDLLFVIDPRPYEARRDTAAAAVDQARASLVLRENNLSRATNLRNPNAIAKEEVDSRVQAVEIAAAQLSLAEADLRAAQLDVEFTKITSPFRGRIGRHLVTPGNLVTADQTLLATIVSIDPIHCYFEADERAYLRYSRLSRSGERPSSRDVANPVSVALMDEQDYRHSGAMDFVDNEVDRSTGTMRGRAILENPTGILTPGLFARIRLLGRLDTDAILIPEVAISTNQSQRFVFVVNAENEIEYRAITLGRSYEHLRIVTEGLEENELVVVRGQQRLREGDRVRPQREEGAPTTSPAR